MELQGIVADGQLLVAMLIALAAGLVSFLSPCVLPLLPGYLAYVSASAGSSNGGSSGGSATAAGTVATSAGTGTTSSSAGTVATADPRRAQLSERRRMVLGSLLFVLGFTLIFVVMMALAGSVGSWLLRWESAIMTVMGVIIITMGLVFMGLFGRMQRSTRLKFKPKFGLAGAPLLGAVFAVGWTPCMGPTLAVIGTLALQGGTAGRGAILAVAYCIGLGAPFVLAAFGFGWMTTATTFFKRHIRVVNIIGGSLLIVIGLMMVTGIWLRIMYSLQAVMGSYVTLL